MNALLMIILIGISLSMDAFSLALIYGTYGISKKDKILLSIIVGIFHFVMPLVGCLVGKMIISNFIFNSNLVVGVIFSIIGIEMIISSIKNEDIRVMDSIVGYLFFGFTVSIDSLTTGIGLSALSSNYLLVSFIFMMVSGSFTFLGLSLGNKLNEKFGSISTMCGGIMMIVLSIYYIFRV